MSSASQEIQEGQRFAFGKNWQDFLTTLDENRIQAAEDSLKELLEVDHMTDKRFLDVGSGSGLSSLAARRLGARVYAFDYDLVSVACTRELRKRYFPDDPDWVVEEGSALNQDYIESLGKFDIVYSWGVLHHTGDLKRALENVIESVQVGGILCLAIYNDQGGASRRWRQIKKIYVSGPVGQWLVRIVFISYFASRNFFLDILRLKNPVERYATYKEKRGMSLVHDWIDWLGGYPFEVAKPETIFKFYLEHGFELRNLITCGGGFGNNQFVFVKREDRQGKSACAV